MRRFLNWLGWWEWWIMPEADDYHSSARFRAVTNRYGTICRPDGAVKKWLRVKP